MPRGARPGERRGGRQKGVPNKASAAREKHVASTGITPLDYMLKVMRDSKVDKGRRDEMAKAAAPYVHPRLQATQFTGANGGPLEFKEVSESRDALERKLARLAGPEQPVEVSGKPH